MITTILKRLENLLFRYNNKNKNQVIRSLGCNGSEGQPRALLSYDLDCLDSNNIDFKYSTNRKENQVILTHLINLGFIVDFFGCRNNYYCDGLRYDLVFGFGDAYRKSLLTQSGIRVLYLTEGPPNFSLANEKERLEFFYKRHGVEGSIERSGTYYRHSDLRLANEIICLGELHKKHIRELPDITAVVQSINPSGLPVEMKKNSFGVSKDVLWFGSRGVIHKGLDLLIDAFNELPDWTLHVCGVEKKDLKGLMKVNGNIKFYGKISFLDKKFTKLIGLCNFSILLSCSEAVPTSVLTCMRAGLLPIVSNNCGTSFPFSITCDDISIEHIKNMILETLELTEDEIKRKSEKISSYADNVYSLNAFSESIKKAIIKCNHRK